MHLFSLIRLYSLGAVLVRFARFRAPTRVHGVNALAGGSQSKPLAYTVCTPMYSGNRNSTLSPCHSALQSNPHTSGNQVQPSRSPFLVSQLWRRATLVVSALAGCRSSVQVQFHTRVLPYGHHGGSQLRLFGVRRHRGSILRATLCGHG